MAQLEALVSGRVQGVGFRWWVGRRCDQLGLDGLGENLADGRVRVTASGAEPALEQLVADLRAGTAGRPGEVDGVDVRRPPAAG